MYSNCRSIVKNYNSLLSLVSLLKHNSFAVAVSELWTNDSNEKLYNILGYNFVVKSHSHASGDRVGLFVSGSYNFLCKRQFVCTIIETYFY